MKLKPFLLTPALLLVTAAPAAAAPPTVTVETKSLNANVIRFPVTFTATATDPEGEALTYAWTVSDGTTATGPTFDRTWDTAGERTATVTVTDADGETATATATVTLVSWDDYRMNVVVDNVSTTQNIAPRPYTPITTAPAPQIVTPLRAAFGRLPAQLRADGKLKLPFTCAAGDSRCTGTVTLRTAKAVKAKGAKGKAKVLTLGTDAKAYAPVGGSGVAAIKVAPAALRTVKALRRVPVVATANLTDAAGQTTTVERRFTLRFAR